MTKRNKITWKDITAFQACNKRLWLRKNNPDAAMVDSNAQMEIDSYEEVKNNFFSIIREKFDNCIDIEEYSNEFDAKQKYTKQFLGDPSCKAILNAAMGYDGFVCHPTAVIKDEKRNITELLMLKISTTTCYTTPATQTFGTDYPMELSYVKWIADHNPDIHIDTYNVVQLNKTYTISNGEPLYVMSNCNELLEMDIIENLMNSFNVTESEPKTHMTMNCKDCQFFKYCTKDLPEYNVFNIYRMNFDKKLDKYNNGWISYQDLLDASATTPKVLNANQTIQVTTTINNGKHIDVNGIQKFVDKVSYPIYYLDFETQMPAIPCYDNMHPYDQELFQFSLHIEEADGTLTHKEFLGESGKDNRRKIAELLCEYIPENACTMAYNKAFECTRIKELASWNPDLSDHLLNIESHIVDLLEVFRGFNYYLPEMKGSFSIKKVLPAVFPNDPELNYSTINEDIHNGGDAMTIFPQIQYMSEDQQKNIREQLLKYCGLDTYAMVKLYNKVKEYVK